MFDDKYTTKQGFVFLRHGETEANHQQVACGGDCQTPMLDSGREQVRQAIEVLRSHQYTPQVILTGDLQRTVDCANIVRSEMNPAAKILIDPDLNERSLGDWNGRNHSYVNPLMVADKTPANGESRKIFRARMMKSLNRQMKHLVDWPLVIGSRGNARILLDMIQDPNAPFFPNGKLLVITLTSSEEFTVEQVERLERRL